MCKQIQNYINFLIVCLTVSNLCFAQEGCTDPEAYNCADDNGVNYTFEVGGITYVNGCNYELNDMLEMEYIGGCESGPCDGYYDPDATLDDGSCDYYQSPHGNDIVFTVADNEISIDWTAFTPPNHATILGYHVSRCIETGCVFITDSPFPWNSNDGITETMILDEFGWESGVEIKYVINVRYENTQEYGMAIGASYITPCNSAGCGCTDPEAYNCADDVWTCAETTAPEDCMVDDEWPNYTFLVGDTPYINGCNYDNTDDYNANLPVYQGGCEDGPCEGYYDFDATLDDGSCDYYQAPHEDDIVFTVADNGILLDWESFEPPEHAHIFAYHVSRCIETGCVFITGNPFPWGSGTQYIRTSIFDEYDWEPGIEIKYAVSIQYANAEDYGMAIGASYITPVASGDINGDGGWNVLDIVQLSNCILQDNCDEHENGYAGDTNGDGGWNVLDVVILSNCILQSNCGGRVDDATFSRLIINGNMVSIKADGFIGGVQMTLKHGDDFTVIMTERALIADYLTSGNETRLLIITPETDKLFSYSGDFEITELIVANSHAEVSASLPLADSFSLSQAYPNPFNPTTTMTLIMPVAGDMKVEIYNLLGQSITTLTSGYKDAGTYKVTWDATDAASGMYFVKAEAEEFTTTQKLMLVK